MKTENFVKNNIRLFGSAIALALASVSMPAAAATLIGDTVTIELGKNGGSFGVQNVVVGAGEEGQYFGNQFFDFGANSFAFRSTGTFTSYSGGPGGSIILALSSLDLGTPITSVDFTTSLTGVSTAFTSDSVSFFFTDQALPAETYLTATFNTAAVPEPATWAMMLIGFGLIGGAIRRRKAVHHMPQLTPTGPISNGV
ncbi:MAG: PEPxxWA-CTERM sorting domain-containing protein [Parasphingorhabdus sp.]|uniref:PEPxxWA-CTERM sorting domain-containing protein n=1 Tax=Parasphingorhabdus sp. TaxID=2709688 RepID=UPI0032985A85